MRVSIEADGGSRGNPGPAGFGAVVRAHPTGEILAERFGALGVTTNNVAEYNGLIAGLKAAAELGATQVDVHMDSKLVVEQMSGRWQIKHPGMRQLAAEAARLIERFDEVTFGWIPRERNKAADALANRAMDGETDPSVMADVAEAADAQGGIDKTRNKPKIPAQSPQLAARSAADARAGETAATAPAAGTAPAITPRSWAPPSTGDALRLILVRHGQTPYTKQGRYSGRGDVPLSDEGEAQAMAAGGRVAGIAGDADVVAIVSSPLRRCVRTAELISAEVGGVPITVVPDLIEVDFGDWEGLTFAEVQERWPDEINAWLDSTSVAPPGGESFTAVGDRVRRALGEVVRSCPSGVVVLVSHVSPIKLILRDALAAGDAFLHRLFLDAAGVSTMDVWPDGNLAVRSVNETAHLR